MCWLRSGAYILDRLLVFDLDTVNSFLNFLRIDQPLKGDSDNPVISACREGVRSRWEVLPSNECTPTDLDAETLEALTGLLQKSSDTNAFIRDITFPKYVYHCSAESKESLEEVSIIIESGTNEIILPFNYYFVRAFSH